jgi:hypothetical protein
MTNPAKGITRFRETARSRILQSHELPALLDAIRAEPEPWASVFQNAVLHRRAARDRRWHAMG